MHCPECGTRTDVYDSRLNTQGLVRRRRSCPKCGLRFATIEVMNVHQPLGSREDPEAPPPAPPPKPEKPKQEKPVKVARQRTASPKREKPRGLDEDIVPWTDDAEDYSRYIEIPRGFDD